ncbi:MAG: 2OG-Fe(II) oxygenase [Alphaproteobacteria bacterium]
MQTKTRSAFAALPPHLVIDGAFGADIAEQLLAFAIAHEVEFVDSGIGNRKGKSEPTKIDKAVRNSRSIRDLGLLQTTVEKAFDAALPRAISGLGLAPFAPTSLSIELAAHGDGGFYRRHIDTFVGNARSASDRVLTGVYYFHDTPKGFSGGALRLHSLLPVEQGGTCTDIEPANDRLLLFPAWVPHEVCEVHCATGVFRRSRFAINCWYNRRPD